MSFSQEIARVISSEFSDVGDLAQVVRIVVRLLLAAVLGFALGFEREQRGKAAGVRTHMLVAIGSALFVLIPQQSGIVPADMSRVIQGLIAGVGFLCAGTILKQGKDEQQVQGLTTAAGLWMTAAIGMACGLGREVTAVLSALLALAVLGIVPRIVALLERVVGPPEKPPATREPDDARR
ncbi:MgtC/SapB family protein [Variovorax sp. PAMC 28711]|uniref:MgtC/SapB family protein n=1 Tax=Variovorax sp. PAMC 28711 TaxID=1795631 RepID=UPI00078EB647|nr:MgtC/SapB family protein [Variovorax sp. PAMC 28711]AMM23992.1 methyltransferase [Variovorax sp. PAMC 28711]